MDRKEVLVALVWCVAVTSVRAADDWAYSGTHGPSHWAESGYDKCAGSKQSPIDLANPTLDRHMGSVSMTGFDQTPDGMTLTLLNNGHSIQVNVEGADMQVEGGKLPSTYKLAQFHFHWGADNKKGSEHTVDGKAMPMEIHFVNYKTDFADLSTAVDKPEGLAVLGFFFKISAADNEALNAICDYMGNVTNYGGGSVVIDPFKLSSLMPSNDKDFYRYPGSLTTPGCYESVLWTVFKESIDISQRQLDLFRGSFFNAKGDEDKPLVDNFRPVQPLGGRTITTNFQTAGGATFHGQWTVALLATALGLLVTRN